MVVTEDEVLSDWRNEDRRFAALVLPDGLARTLSASFLGELRRFVENGGRLLVVFDAGILVPQGQLAPDRSALSELVGVDYALQEPLGDARFRSGPVFASAASARTLGIPPGLAIEDPKAPAPKPFNVRLTSYGYPELIYTSLVTAGRYDGEPLLVGPEGQIVAGIRSLGKGRVIFANLPLGDLKLNATDGWPLHRFLKFLGAESGLPMLAMTPGGVGGMIMNIHVDCATAIRPLEQMLARGLFKTGPFSIHVTAGPDCTIPGDALGIDVPHNPPFRRLLRTLTSRGHEIGDHGGWIHNYWTSNVTDDSADRHEHLLELNTQALARAIGQPIRVYSSPSGLHPLWVTNWLRRHDFFAHYATANIAAAPTRGYRNGELEDDGIWSFPIVTFGLAASFEEAAERRLDERSQVIPFLEALTRFTADQHEVRMFYLHPTGIHLYEHALPAWIAQARALGGRFRWYTMAALSAFLDRREAARWTVTRGNDGDRIEAETSDSLRDLTWLVSADRYGEPRIIDGRAKIGRDGADWTVTATKGMRLVIHLPHGNSNSSFASGLPD
jgi:peptidoglycan/xylan/chitin deacetylase (PgdA/CDA1 family)